MALRIPTSQLDRPEGTAGARTPFPEGLWFSEIGDVSSKETPDFMSNAKPGKRPEVANGGTQLGIRFDNSTAAEDGQAEVGNQKHFLDLIVSDGTTDIMDVDPAAKEAPYGWGIQRDARMLARLARALGQTTDIGDATEIAADFVTQLQAGAFKGQKVLLRTEVETFKKNDGSPGAKAVTKEILPA